MASILSILNCGYSSNEASCSFESMAPMSSRGASTVGVRSMPSTFAPFSAAEMTAGRPAVRQPTTSTSVLMVSAMSRSATSGAWPSQLGVPGTWPALAFTGSSPAGTV